MDFDWHEDKRLSNIRKHGLDFVDATGLFHCPHVQIEARSIRGEPRWLAVGEVHGRLVTVVFTRRGEVIRLISMRRSRDEEKRQYRQVFFC